MNNAHTFPHINNAHSVESQKKQQKQQQSHNTCKHQTIKSKVNKYVKIKQTSKHVPKEIRNKKHKQTSKQTSKKTGNQTIKHK